MPLTSRLIAYCRSHALPLVFIALVLQPVQAQEANPPAEQVQEENPHTVVQQATDDLLLLLDQSRTEEWDAEYFDARVMELLEPFIYTRYIVAQVMGVSQYRAASKEQRKRFEQSFTQVLLSSYSKAIRELRFESVDVLSSGGGTPADKRVIIPMRVRTATQDVELQYILYWSKKKGWRLINLRVAGADILRIFQSQFRAAMVEFNNDLDRVIDSWDSQNQQAVTQAQQEL